MNACLQFDAPGIGGPEDAPEYQGPTVEELTEQKVKSADFVQMWSADVPLDVFQLLIDSRDEDFAHRFRYEMRKLAEASAREEFDDSVREWERSL